MEALEHKRLGEEPYELPGDKPLRPKPKREIVRITACSECGSKSIQRDYSRAEIICNDCGLVVDEMLIDAGPEWRAFDVEQRMARSRTGAPLTATIHDKGLTTEIDWRNTDAFRKQLSPKRTEQMRRLRRMQKRTRISNAQERNMAFALSEIDRMSSSLSLPKNIREQASIYYRRAVEKDLIKGRAIEAVAAAALYAACRAEGVPRTLDEIAAVSKVDRKDIGRAYRLISRELELKLVPVSSTDYIDRFCSVLGLDYAIRRKAYELLTISKERKLLGAASPDGLAAASIYAASLLLNLEIPRQRELAEVAGVSEVTIRNRYKELVAKLGLDLGPTK